MMNSFSVPSPYNQCFFGRKRPNFTREKFPIFGRENIKCPRKKLKTTQKSTRERRFLPEKKLQICARETRKSAREKNDKFSP